MDFIEKLLTACRNNRSLLCVGLDPDPSLMPKAGLVEFNKAIISATSDLVCAYKPNIAFYEAEGIEGMYALQETIESIPGHIPVILDAKRGDIGNTAKAYARAAFEMLKCDAVTVSPYLGYDSLEPFLNYREKGVIIICRTSNKGAVDLQDVNDAGGTPLYKTVAKKALSWNSNGNIGLVVGATYPQELADIRAICPEMPILIPGVGAQGGDLALAVQNGVDARKEKAIINVSRQVLYASSGPDFAGAARKSAKELRDKINEVLNRI